MIEKAKSLVLVVTAACFVAVIILRLLSVTTIPEILFGCFLVVFLCSYIVITAIEELPFLRTWKRWFDGNRSALDKGFVLILTGSFVSMSLFFEPMSVWEQVLKIFGLCFFGIGGMLFVYALFRK